MNTQINLKYVKTILAISPIAISLAMLAVVTFADSTFAGVSGTTNDGCTNGSGNNVDGKTTCPPGKTLEQSTCHATTGNGKCPKGQN